MNRPLKFRVWDNELKKFGNPDQYGLILRYGLIHGKEKHPEYGIYYNPNVIIQQYTGLKDKNGKEIYEGDIIRAMHDFGPAGFRSHISAVRWDKEVGYQWEYWDLSTIEIIGNIFETKNYFNEIPQEVKNAAVFLGDYFKKQGIDNWTLYDVSSRK